MKVLLLHEEDIKKDARFFTRPVNEAVVEDVRRNGLLNPLAVWREGERYVLIDGYSRVEAFKHETNIPVVLVEGSLLDAMRERCRRNFWDKSRGMREAAQSVCIVLEANFSVEEVASHLLPPCGLEPSVEVVNILARVKDLDPVLASVLEKRRATLKFYEWAVFLPREIQAAVARAAEKYNLSISRVRLLMEAAANIYDRQGAAETAAWLDKLMREEHSSCMFMYYVERMARPRLWAVNEALDKLDLEVRKRGPFKLRWDRTLESDEVVLEVHYGSKVAQKNLSELTPWLKEVLERAWRILRDKKV